MGRQSPRQMSVEARNDAIAAFEDANAMGSVAETASAEQQAAHDFCERLGEAVLEGLSPSEAKQQCGVIADVANNYTKTALKELLEEKIEEAREDQNDRRPFDEVLKSELMEVVIVRTTDAKQSTTYRWQFTGGTVETSSTAEGRVHFSWGNFRDEYYAAVGEDPGKPTKNRRGGEEWREFIVCLIEERGREVTTRGPRTVAVDRLQNFIRRTDAYGHIEHVAERTGIYIDADPVEDEPSEIWIPNQHIKRIADEAELESTRSMQIELDSRGYTCDDRNGVSHSTFVNNKKITFWVVDSGIATPASYVKEPLDPAEQVRLEEEEEAEDDDDDDVEPGAIGSVGGDGQ